MHTPIHRQTPLRFRRSYKPCRILRIRPVTKLHFVPCPIKNGFGSKPVIVAAE